MPQHPSDTQQPDVPSIEALPAHASERDMQRAALRELVGLLTESATTESEIEARHAAAREELNKSTERSAQDIDHKYTALREAADQKHTEWIAEVDSTFQTGMEALDASNDTIRKRINQDHDGV